MVTIEEEVVQFPFEVGVHPVVLVGHAEHGQDFALRRSPSSSFIRRPLFFRPRYRSNSHLAMVAMSCFSYVAYSGVDGSRWVTAVQDFPTASNLSSYILASVGVRCG